MLYFLIGLAVLSLLLSFICYRLCFYSRTAEGDDFRVPETDQYAPYKNRSLAMIKSLLEKPCERVNIISFDGLKLSARLYRLKENAPVCICAHGWHGTAARDFSGGAAMLMDFGYNVLLLDQRAHGESEGHTLSFGINESRDLLSWITYINNKFGEKTPVYLYGVSMGAATVCMSAGMDLPVNVRGIVADSPYSSAKDIIIHTADQLKLPGKLLYPFARVGARLFGHGADIEKMTAADQIRRCRIPLLIIHGTDDRFVPCSMSEEIAAANPLVQREVFDGAGHVMSFLTDEPRYRTIIRDFMERTLA